MKAVESGDATKVADMVKAAAKRAMPDTKVVDADGYSYDMGTDKDFPAD